ncbi:MAG: DUF6159 family protein [Ahrensia sp.]|nr:DUF6159 family protein [Ahrensia sp.]
MRRDPVLADGLSVACKRFHKSSAGHAFQQASACCLAWLKTIMGFLGNMISNLLGLGWRVGTFFTVPVIVAEEKSAIESIKRSGELVKKNWGEALTLEVGFSFIASLMMMIPVGLCILATLAFAASGAFAVSGVVGGLLFVSALVGMLTIPVVFSTLNAIAKAALYIYACSDKPVGFSEELLEKMFKRNNLSAAVAAYQGSTII